jgi:hypothetical protein
MSFFLFMGVSIRFLISWGLQLIDLLTYPGGVPRLTSFHLWSVLPQPTTVQPVAGYLTLDFYGIGK